MMGSGFLGAFRQQKWIIEVIDGQVAKKPTARGVFGLPMVKGWGIHLLVVQRPLYFTKSAVPIQAKKAPTLGHHPTELQ